MGWGTKNVEGGGGTERFGSVSCPQHLHHLLFFQLEQQPLVLRTVGRLKP